MIRVVQWNSHHGGKRTDDKLDTKGFAAAIAKLRPDVVCLNEIEQFHSYGDADQAGIMAEALGPEWKAYTANLSGTYAGKGQSNAILARSSEVSSTLGIRALTKARVAIALTVRNVTIVSTHLDAEKQDTRIVQGTQILMWDAVRDRSPIILAGDWNAVSPSALELAAFRHFFKDAWVQAKSIGQATAFNTSGDTRHSRIDAIFYRGVNLLACDVPDTRPTPAAPFPSDHSPVVATFA